MRILPPVQYVPTMSGLVKNLVLGSAIYPFYASFKLTSQCHFGCPFCNVKKNAVPDLSTADIKKILDNLSRSSVLMTSFEGGEPLLRDDILELLAYARSCKFYLLFTTSVRNMLEYPLKRYAPYIDFFHVSIDEGHNNLELFDALPTLAGIFNHVSVQTVVTRDTLNNLEPKIARCNECGVNTVVIPATHMDDTTDQFPNIDQFEVVLRNLKKKYPATIHTPMGYFKALKNHKCSSASVIIAPDGRLYYPCHILNTKGPDLRKTDLMQWLKSPQAQGARAEMHACKRNCGWYQYYSIDSYTSIRSVWEALGPVLKGK